MNVEETLRAEALATTAEELRAVFAAVEPLTVGLEEELMLLHPETLELAPVAEAALERLGGDPRFKRELPAAQLEIALDPARSVGEAIAALAAARRDLAGALAGLAVPAAAAVHPTSPVGGALSDHPRYDRTRSEYGPVAARQVVFALQVHVAVGDADHALAVYNAARSYLPLLAALAANGPFYGGRDSGMASVRPKICELLPRQGVPPALASWAQYAAALSWGARTGFFPSRGAWWWELRLHPRHGTLEFRVPDAQSTVHDAAAVAGVVQALVARLLERASAGEALPVQETWQIEENRWSACRHGVEGVMVAPETDLVAPTRELLASLLDELSGHRARLGLDGPFARARELCRANGAMLQREVAAAGVGALPGWLAARFPPARSG